MDCKTLVNTVSSLLFIARDACELAPQFYDFFLPLHGPDWKSGILSETMFNKGLIEYVLKKYDSGVLYLTKEWKKQIAASKESQGNGSNHF